MVIADGQTQPGASTEHLSTPAFHRAITQVMLFPGLLGEDGAPQRGSVLHMPLHTDQDRLCAGQMQLAGLCLTAENGCHLDEVWQCTKCGQLQWASST